MTAWASGEAGLRAVFAPLTSLHHRHVRLPRADRLALVLAELSGPARSVLDVGSGDGRVGARFAQLVGASRALGLDVTPQANAAMETLPFDGEVLPVADESFEIVLLVDVLHHAAVPERLLREALRVASRAVLVKDHLAFSAASRGLLWAMDLAGNFEQSVAVRGRYLDPASLLRQVEQAGGKITAFRWPLDVHAPWLRAALPSRLHFAAALQRRTSSARSAAPAQVHAR